MAGRGIDNPRSAFRIVIVTQARHETLESSSHRKNSFDTSPVQRGIFRPFVLYWRHRLRGSADFSVLAEDASRIPRERVVQPPGGVFFVFRRIRREKDEPANRFDLLRSHFRCLFPLMEDCPFQGSDALDELDFQTSARFRK